MRLVIICEGQLEKQVLKKFLAPYCTGFDDVKVRLPDAQTGNAEGGSGRFKQNFQKISEDILAIEPDTYVFCLLDLKGHPFDHLNTPIKDSLDRYYEVLYKRIKQYMESLISAPYRDRFFAFPVVMEIETWMLADQEALQRFFSSQTIKRPHTPETDDNPKETIVGYFNQHKAKRGQRWKYSEVTDGASIFKHMDAKRVYEDSCPHFKLLIDQLLEIQNGSVAPKSYTDPNQDLLDEIRQLEQERELLDMAETTKENVDKLDRIQARLKMLYEDYSKKLTSSE